MKCQALGLAAALSLLSACGTNREYRSADLSSERAYKKEKSSAQIKESDLLRGKEGNAASDEEIRQILDETRTFPLKEHSTVLLVQSGSERPDAEMIEQVSKHFTVIPYTGVRTELKSEADGEIGRALRLAAAHAKAETVLVYWGNLEMKRDDLPTGIVSWVPVVDFVVPDEYQKVRMSLRVALIDVRSARWTTFRTDAIEDQTLTTRFAREKAPNWTLHGIKERAYHGCVQKLMDGYIVARSE